MIKQEVFENAAEKWKTMKEFPWARMRYEITNELLLNSVNSSSMSILNIGCGDGIETLLLDAIEAESDWHFFA